MSLLGFLADVWASIRERDVQVPPVDVADTPYLHELKREAEKTHAVATMLHARAHLPAIGRHREPDC